MAEILQFRSSWLRAYKSVLTAGKNTSIITKSWNSLEIGAVIIKKTEIIYAQHVNDKIHYLILSSFQHMPEIKIVIWEQVSFSSEWKLNVQFRVL